MDVVNSLLQQVVNTIFGPIATLLFGVAIVVFMWGLIQFIGSSDNAEGVKKGKSSMIWGVVGIFIMLSVIGIKQIIVNSLPGNPDDPTSGVFGGQ